VAILARTERTNPPLCGKISFWMAVLRYEFTFIKAVEPDSPFRRPRSTPARLRASTEEEMKCSRYVTDLLPRMREDFQWPVEPIESSHGSLGHPELCGRPCVRYAYGNCVKGRECGFCHMRHDKPKLQLDKGQRQCFESLEEAEVLTLLLPHLESRAKNLSQADLLLASIKRRLKALPPAAVSKKTHSTLNILSRMNVRRLLELVDQSRFVCAAYKAELKELQAQSLQAQSL
ncbi:unnamed protein product, partial [Effrenium voratum]